MVQENKQLDIYKVDTSKKLNKIKVLIVILSLVAVLLMILIILHIINIYKNYRVFKQYEAQAIQIVQEQEEKARKEEEEKEEKERIRQERLPKLTDVGKENIKNIYHSDTKRAFLTFDDGPSSVTPTILDILKNENIKATFFVLGSRVEAMPSMVKRMYDEGHFIANHGYSHVYENIYASPESVLDEYTKCNNAVRNAIGEQDYESHLFRFPGGLAGGKYADTKLAAKELLNQNNVVNVDWNALNGDGETNNLSIEFELERLKNTTEGKNSVVILMHDAPVKQVTSEALPQIISYLREQGYEFKSFYDFIK